MGLTPSFSRNPNFSTALAKSSSNAPPLLKVNPDSLSRSRSSATCPVQIKSLSQSHSSKRIRALRRVSSNPVSTVRLTRLINARVSGSFFSYFLMRSPIESSGSGSWEISFPRRSNSSGYLLRRSAAMPTHSSRDFVAATMSASEALVFSSRASRFFSSSISTRVAVTE